jgi:hypothetical protein
MIAGITGHQDLGPADAVEWVRTSLDELVARERITSGLTSLAEGADQLFTRVLESRGLPFIAVIPSASYESAFRSAEARAAYAELVRRAKSSVSLAFDSPTEEAFFAAGRYVALNCDILLAVWNGLPAKGLGGTADIVRFAVANKRRTIHVNPTTRTLADL